MGFWSGVCSFVSSACSFVGSAVSKIGSALVSAASSFIEKLGPVIGAVCNILKSIGVSLGIIKPEDEIDELGAKACETDKKPEDFESIQEYINHLKNDVKLDKEKFEKRTEAEKLAHQGIGATLVKKGVEEKVGIDITDDFLGFCVKGALSGSETLGLINAFKANNSTSTEKFDSYMKNKLSLEEKIKTGSIIEEGLMLAEENQGKSKSEIQDKVIEMELKADR